MEGIYVNNITEDNLNDLLAKFPKLNELSDHQLEAVKDIVRDGFSYGFIYGEAKDKKEVSEAYESLVGKLLLMRAWFASITALIIGNYVAKYTTDGLRLILYTSAINTVIFFVLRWLMSNLKRSAYASGRTQQDNPEGNNTKDIHSGR